MLQSLSGKTAMVIGGSRGIGAAIVRKLANEGAKVAFTYASSADAATQIVDSFATENIQVHAYQADSADPAQLTSVINQAAEALNGLDILVNNAGILMIRPFEEYSIEDFDRIFAVNVRGVFVAIQAALPHLRRGSRIITIGSIAGETARAPGSTLYGATKATVARMVQGLAWDLAQRGITINDVQPGPIETDMTPGTGAVAEHLINVNPLKRLGKPEEVANFVAYLAGPDSGYINGAGLRIDGGFVA